MKLGIVDGVENTDGVQRKARQTVALVAAAKRQFLDGISNY